MEVVRSRSFRRSSAKASAAATANPCELALKAPAGIASPGWNVTSPDSPVIQVERGLGRPPQEQAAHRQQVARRDPQFVAEGDHRRADGLEAPGAHALDGQVLGAARLEQRVAIALEDMFCAQRPTSIRAMNAHRLSK